MKEHVLLGISNQELALSMLKNLQTKGSHLSNSPICIDYWAIENFIRVCPILSTYIITKQDDIEKVVDKYVLHAFEIFYWCFSEISRRLV